MRIVFILPIGTMGGAETLTLNVARELSALGHDVSFVVLKSGGGLADRCGEEGLECVTLGVEHGASPLNGLELVRVLRRRQPDVAISVNFNATFWGRVAALLARVPVVVTAEHSSATLSEREGKTSPLVNRILGAWTDAIIALDPAQACWLQSQGNPTSKIVIIANGIRLLSFLQVSETRERYSVGATVGIVASLLPAKNHKRFMRIASRVVDSAPNTRFAVIGDGPLLHEMRHYADELGLGSNVQFAGRTDDVAAVLGEMDVVCLTSDTETMPLTLMEASAAGRPIVATDVGGVGSVVVDGVTGFVVTPADEELFAERLLLLLRSHDLRREFGRAGRARACAIFDVRRTAAEYEAMLDRIVGIKSDVAGS